ncbi:4'-phosphopantetheinyl transferase family protein [Denitrobacterium detoxificans]|uniref:4'-phosphopantetheinyl transferase n=1 Tax=Denitrobacterium detoxificans TaxID=79604 RepID=A0A1H8TQX3_9ACTN|nr:4'-phosphopantetheinyl transferase superfamily protein [Denitrobacterium detoxificans]SEO93265.1 4'-phosphopantetheinyl transferase [Denitrobacterium detoxificans]
MPVLQSLDGPIVWVVDTRNTPGSCEEWDAWLTERERNRAASFKFERLASFYRAVHAGVRLHVAALAGVQPNQVAIDQLPCPRCGSVRHGPPSLVVEGTRLHFSLSKAQPYCAFAIAPFPVGVDVERGDASSIAGELASDAFTARELDAIRAHGPHEALRLWVRKEALVKARGIGFADAPSKICAIDDVHACEDGTWHVRDIVQGEALQVALCVPLERAEAPVCVKAP